MLKNIIFLTTIILTSSSVFAESLSCGQKEESTQKTFLGEMKKPQNSFINQAKSKPNPEQANKERHGVCDEHCAEKAKADCEAHCTDKKKCTDHTGHKH